MNEGVLHFPFLIKVDSPWNVIAIKMNTTAIKLTWLPPKVRQPGKMVS